jgi:hypothetical protein
MELYKHLGSYFFIVGAIISIFAGVFPINPEEFTFIMVAILFLGIFSAILNIDGDDLRFVIAAAGFLIMIIGAEVLLGGNVLVEHLVTFFQVSTLFVGSMLATITLKLIVEYGGQALHVRQEDVADRVEMIAYSTADNAWNFIVFLAIAASFIMVLLEIFFPLTVEEWLLFFLADLFITGIFAIDLVVLYRRSASFKHFVQTSWLDIIATIPFYSVLRVAKIARLVRLMRFLKLNKTLKFFSERSGARHYLHENPPGASGEMFGAATPATETVTVSAVPQPTVTPRPSSAPARKAAPRTAYRTASRTAPLSKAGPRRKAR